MTDLVSDDRRELGLVVHEVEQSTRDEDVAAWQGERVRAGIVDGAKRPREIRPLGLRSKRGSDALEIILQSLVIDESDLLRNLLRALLPHLDFLLFRDERKLSLAGHRVGCARDERERDESPTGGRTYDRAERAH
jgi:hypothetical protein